MKKIKLNFNGALLLIFAVLFITISIMRPEFLSVDYVIGVMLRNIVEIGLVALPVTLIIITGGIDLSVGAILVLSAITGGIAGQHLGAVAGFFVSFLVGGACGLFNAILIAKVKISPLVTTLASMFLFMGISRGISAGDSVYTYNIATFLGTTNLFGFLPLQIVIYAVLAVVFWFLLSKTPLGRKVYAIGYNEDACVYAGVKTDRIKIILYVLSGLMCALCSVIYLGRFTSVNVAADAGFNLKVVTIIVLGGASILGGVGDIKGTIIATMIIAVLNSGLTVMDIPVDNQTIVHGCVLILSLITYAMINDRAKKKKVIQPIEVIAEQ